MISTSLRARFAITFAASIMAGSAVLSSAIGGRSTEQVRQEIGRNLANVTYQIADKLDRGMWARIGEVSVLSTLVQLTDGSDIPAVQTALDRLQEAVPLFSWIGFTDPKGKVLAASGGILVGADIAKRPVYVEGLKGTFVGDVHEAILLAKLLPNPSGEPMKFVDVSTAVQAKGQLVGVLAAHLSWAWAREIEASVLEPQADRDAIEVFVVAADDTVLMGPKDFVGKPLRLGAVERARAGHEGWQVERWADGRDYLTSADFGKGHKTYKGLGWTVVARQSLDTAYAPVMALQRYIMLWGAAIAAIFAVFGWFVAGHVAAPLRRIAQAADQLRAGNRVAIPPHRGILDIEILTESLQSLIASLTQTETDRDEAASRASHDTLTGLPNRRALEAYLDRAVADSRRNDGALAVLCMDLDGFKAVNDTRGHHVGDLLLQEVAHRLRACARSGDIVARLGGDEFVMVLPTPAEAARVDGRAVGQRVIAALSAPMTIEGAEIRIGCSVGVACWPVQHEDISQVVQCADQALYASKRGGKGRVSFYEDVQLSAV